MKWLDTINEWLNRVLAWLAGAFLVGMVLLTCTNIFLRVFWTPVRGTFELMGFFGAVVTAFALGYTQMKKGHISVDVLVETFSPKRRRVLVFINNVVCCIFFVLAAWQLAIKANTLRMTGEVTETLRIIYYPFTYAVAFGCLVLALVMVIDLIRRPAPSREEDP